MAKIEVSFILFFTGIVFYSVAIFKFYMDKKINEEEFDSKYEEYVKFFSMCSAQSLGWSIFIILVGNENLLAANISIIGKFSRCLLALGNVCFAVFSFQRGIDISRR